MGHPELDCEALSFLLQWKLGVKGNHLNAMDRENKHTANKTKHSKYGKLYFIEHSSEYLSI